MTIQRLTSDKVRLPDTEKREDTVMMDTPHDAAAAEGLGERELDREIQRVVFGTERFARIPTIGEPHNWFISTASGSVAGIPPYSTDIAAAMLVFFAMVECHGHAEIICDMEDYGREPSDIVTVVVGLDEPRSYTGRLPEAICRVALQGEAGA